MLSRSTISRREPVIALDSFRYRGRNYKEGGYLDRRRCRMPHSKLIRLIREGVCILAKDVSPEKLAEYGFTYTPKSPRLKLTRIPSKSIQELNDLKMKEFFNEDASPEPTLKHTGGGWYDVMVNGEALNDKSLRKDDAIALIEDQE